MPFWASIGVLSLAQGAIVALPSVRPHAVLTTLRSRLWALVPAASIVVFVAVGSFAADGSAKALTYLALIAVPPLAALALAALMRGARPSLALAAVGLFALSWADRSGLAGQAAALALAGLSCVALGALLASATPARWLAAGIVAMALADAALVIADLLQRPDSALVAAHPVGGLPRLQTAIFGSASMGYGDLFVAGLLGGLLALHGSGARQLRGALLTTLLALAFDLLFFAVSELPATVPVAAALVLLSVRSRPARRSRPPMARLAAERSSR